MYIQPFSESDSSAASQLFNQYAGSDYLYKTMPEPAFRELFTVSSDRAVKINLAARAGNDDFAGFASGCLVPGKEIGYVTFVLVDKAYRRQGIGARLLAELEAVMKAKTPLMKLQMIFFNPVALTWIVPGTPGHDHPNAPGVDVASDAYIFFKNQGYTDRVLQNSYYLPLDRFSIKPEVQAKMDALPQHDLSICFYDPAKHFGMEELLEDLGSDDWREQILGNLARPDGGDPVIIAEHKGKVVGFTGPIRVQESGRGYFAGIGVHSQYRQYGLGKSLFSTLCQSLKNIGAGYMTLFTGETNPARRIYQSAGFKIVRTWSAMEKEI